MTKKGTLYFFCGKMGAGKSTHAKVIAADHNALLISEDDWLSQHYPDQIKTFDDYLKYSRTIKPFIKAHVQKILNCGTSVVMDFPANTVSQRSWFINLCAETDAEHLMFFLDLTDQQCLEHIAKRRAEQPHRAHFDTETVFYQVTDFFEPPGDDEPINMERLG